MSIPLARYLRPLFRLSLCSAVLLSLSAFAQGYPSKPIRVISPWPAGGPADAIVRPILEKMATLLGQPMLVVNRPGANGELGTASAASSEPDGYTLLFASTGPNILSAAMQRELRYDPIKSFEPITKLVDNSSLIVVRATLPVKDLKEFVAYAKANPGQLNYASAGAGSGPQLNLENLKRTAGLDIKEIPYPGMGQATIDMLGDRIDIMSAQLGSMLPHVRSGKVRALAVANPKRSAQLPGLPTVGEVVPGYPYRISWYGLMAPAGTPRDIIDRLYSATQDTLKDPVLSEKLSALGLETVNSTPAQFSEELKRELVEWTREMKSSGLLKN